MISDMIFPSYLTIEDKSRLSEWLKQFKNHSDQTWNSSKIDYTNFISTNPDQSFLQSDLIKEIRYANLIEVEGQLTFEKTYTNAIILSNSCDINPENDRNWNVKECVLAPVIKLSEYQNNLIENDYSDYARIIEEIKQQKITNLFYIPDLNSDGYIAKLDKSFWFSAEELNSYTEDISENRILSLTLFGYYLFLVKLSYHFCRFPSEKDRGLN